MSDFSKSKFYKMFNGKNILITGHTGFKGSWLTVWLRLLGANVIGLSNEIPSNPSHIEATGILSEIEDTRLDVCDLDKVKKVISKHNPDFVFHLAAQSLVRKSYQDPINTWQTNLIGSINVMESIRSNNNSCICVMITSDKAYDNKEWVWGYRENDVLGGPDPYSASKGSAELAINSYFKSYFRENKNVKICSARAGNVIGGGDWAEDRIVPDCIRSWTNKEDIILRSPGSTRPWQHVLEPISGYLTLASEMSNNQSFSGESFNFGPSFFDSKSVYTLVEELSVYLEDLRIKKKNHEDELYESRLLQLNCDKSANLLAWNSTLDFNQTIKFTAEWYRNFYLGKQNVLEFSIRQIEEYCNIAQKKGLKWAR